MKKITFAVIGLGNRGTAYIKNLQMFPDKAEIVAIADTRKTCVDAANEFAKLPNEMCFDGADSILAQKKLADVMIVATQDAQHREHAIRAMEVGYDLILEKPISNTLEDIQQIVSAAERLNRRVVVCHVLRYTPFYQTIKRLLNEGAVGRIINVEAAEHVRCEHMAHAYVRGKWRRKEDSSPIILAKCCHDLDLILWLTGKHCLRLSSFGGLDYFNADNCPEGATERCMDGCPVKNCPYHAVDFYIPRIPNWPNNIIPNPTVENTMELLRTTQYGKCIFKQDNNVVDHQSVNMLLEGGITVTFNMSAFHTRSNRTIRISGTEGEIWGDLLGRIVYYQPHGQEVQTFDISNQLIEGARGHSGGDYGLARDVLRYFSGEEFDSSNITTLSRSAESHYVAFAAEESRLHNGRTIEMDEFTL